MRLSVKIESIITDVLSPKKWNICCCGSEKCALSHGVGVSQGPVHDCIIHIIKFIIHYLQYGKTIIKVITACGKVIWERGICS